MRPVLWLALGLVLLAWAGEIAAAGAPPVLTLAVFAAGLSCAVPQALVAVWGQWKDRG